MVADPEVVEEKVTEQEPLADSVQLVVVPKPPMLAVKLTMPVGVLGIPRAASAMVAVQLLVWLVVIEEGVQLTVVVVGRKITVREKAPLLPVWVESPPYTPAIESVPVAVGITATLQPPTKRVHGPPGVNVTVPAGVIAVPELVSTTPASQNMPWPTMSVDETHVIVVDVVLRLTVTVVLPELAE
jgi:hypothetical protein